MPEAPTNPFSATLSPLDWAALSAYAMTMLGIGWWYSRQNRNADDYLVGGRNMNPIAVGLSYFVAIFSTITYLALPGEMVRNGPIIFGGLIGLPFVYYIVGYFLIPVFMTLKVNSGYELLEDRLGNVARLLGVVLFLLLRFLWMAVILFASVDKVLAPLLNASSATSIWLLISLAALAILYASMGGLKAIVAVDVMQFCLLFGGVVVSLAVIVWRLGSVDWWPTEWPAHWQQPHFLPGQGGDRSVLIAALAIIVWNVCTAGSDQMAIQRYLSTRDVRAARQMLGISLLATCGIQLVLGCLGIGLLAFASQSGDAVEIGGGVNEFADQLFPRFIVSTLPTGLAGLMIAGLLAEALNSLASGINAASAVITNDLLSWVRPQAPNPRQELRLARAASIASGVIVVILSLGVGAVQGNLLEVTYKLVNLLTGPLFSLFFMAIFIRWGTSFGAICGAIAGVITAITINFWQEVTTLANAIFATHLMPTPPLSFLWATPLSLLVAALTGMIVSLLPIGVRVSQRIQDSTERVCQPRDDK